MHSLFNKKNTNYKNNSIPIIFMQIKLFIKKIYTFNFINKYIIKIMNIISDINKF